MRIEEIARTVGGKKRLSALTGISESQLYRYVNGESVVRLDNAIAIAKAGGRSVEWLALGEEGRPTKPEEPRAPYSAARDAELLEYVLEGVEIEIARRGLRVDPRRKARVVRLLVEYFVDRERDHTAFDRFLELLQP